MTEEAELVLSAVAAAPRSHGDFWRVPCPLCASSRGTPDRKASLAVSKRTGFYQCWRCGEKGKTDLGSRAEPLRQPIPHVEQFEPPESWLPLHEDDMAAEPGRRYVAQRLGLDITRDREACLGFCPSGRYALRLVVPVLAEDGETWLGYAARDVTGRAKVKYRYPPGMRRHLYNRVALRRASTVLVVEGTLDALAHWPRAVALLGKPSSEQFEELAAHRGPLAVCLDGDAQQEAWALAARLRLRGVPAYHVPLGLGEDPATVTREDLAQRAASAAGGGSL